MSGLPACQPGSGSSPIIGDAVTVDAALGDSSLGDSSQADGSDAGAVDVGPEISAEIIVQPPYGIPPEPDATEGKDTVQDLGPQPAYGIPPDEGF